MVFIVLPTLFYLQFLVPLFPSPLLLNIVQNLVYTVPSLLTNEQAILPAHQNFISHKSPSLNRAISAYSARIRSRFASLSVAHRHFHLHLITLILEAFEFAQTTILLFSNIIL